MKSSVSRRHFLAASAAVLASAPLTQRVHASAPAEAKPAVCLFSKYLPNLGYPDLAKACKSAGLDGVDLTVRKGGHVEPGNVARDLPKAVEAFRAEGLEVCMISTTLSSGGDPSARPILETAAAGGIRFFRIGGQQYDKNRNPLEQLPRFTEELRSLAALADEIGITAGYHNHSGYDNVGGALWDLQRMIESVGSKHLGSNFDVAHAAVEGAYGMWQTNARMMAPYVKMMAVKDFVWDGDKPKWVPLGEGVVKTAAFLHIMKAAGFTGPISLHFEYKTPSQEVLLEDIGKACAKVREMLKETGYA